MVRKWVAGLIAAVVLMSMGGVGFAAFTSTVYMNFNDSAGSLTIVWVAPSSHPAMIQDQPNDVCSDYLTPTTFTINVSNAAPGDGCSIPASDGIFIEDTGTLGGSITVTNTVNLGPCTWFASDNFVPFGTFPAPIAPGQSLPPGGLGIHVYMGAGQGNDCQGAAGFTTADFEIVATAGT